MPITNLTKQDLIDFEEDIKKEYLMGKIPYAIHLRSGNEDQLIKIFENIKEKDFLFLTWASHLENLLKGVPKDELKAEIMRGKSITISCSKYRTFSSAIVGSICAIATGAAMGLKRQGKNEQVYCFVGDMCALSGKFYEAYHYSVNFDLPIVFIVADNELSVLTDTYKVHGIRKLDWIPIHETIPMFPFGRVGIQNIKFDGLIGYGPKLIYYKYKSGYPHSGCGTRVSF